jgi:hypothetical protein
MRNSKKTNKLYLNRSKGKMLTADEKTTRDTKKSHHNSMNDIDIYLRNTEGHLFGTVSSTSTAGAIKPVNCVPNLTFSPTMFL